MHNPVSAKKMRNLIGAQYYLPVKYQRRQTTTCTDIQLFKNTTTQPSYDAKQYIKFPLSGLLLVT